MTEPDALLDALATRARAARDPLDDATRAAVLARVLAAAAPAAVAVEPMTPAAPPPARRWPVAAGLVLAAAAALAVWLATDPPAAPAPPAPAAPGLASGSGTGSHAGPGTAMAGTGPAIGPAAGSGAGSSAGSAGGSGRGSGGPDDRAAVARELLRLGYVELFERADTRAVDELYRRRATALDAVVVDPMVDPHARFLAAEVLFARRPGFPPPALRAALAPVYAAALASTDGAVSIGWLPGNAWGLLYDLGTSTVGDHLLALGPAAIPALRALLDRERVVTYWGSKEATVGNGRAYRVKDVAAYFAARLAGQPLALGATPAERDRAITALARALPR